MGLRGITLNTPPEEEAHIIAEDDAAIYQSIFGEDGVFTIGDRMKATVINNNQVRVSNGVICVGGHIARTVYGDYSDMTIENGEISKNRNDIITAVFSTTGEKGIDKFKIEVKKGTPGVVAEDPELTKENLYEGGKLRELPLWRVKLEGINIIGVEQMFKIIHKIPDLEEMIESLNGKITPLTDSVLRQPAQNYTAGQKYYFDADGWVYFECQTTNADGYCRFRIFNESDAEIFGFQANATATQKVAMQSGVYPVKKGWYTQLGQYQSAILQRFYFIKE